jgi:hypothetical protein
MRRFGRELGDPADGCLVNGELAVSGGICLKFIVRGGQESKYDRIPAMTRMWIS